MGKWVIGVIEAPVSNCEQSSNGRPEPWRRKIFRAATHCIPPCSRDHDRTPRVGTLVVARTTAATGSIIGRIKLTTLVRAPLPANASFARGAYLMGGEIVPSSGLQTDRTVTLVAFESEYAFRYTRLAGEVIHDTFATPSGHVGATTWFVEGQQTIAAALVRRRPPRGHFGASRRCRRHLRRAADDAGQ